MNIFSNVITLAGVTFILTVLSPLAIAILVMIVLFNLMISARIKKIQVAALKKLVVIGRKFGYYGNLNMDLSIGKDVRLYEAQSLIEERTRKFNEEGREGDQALNGPIRKFSSISTLASFIQQAGLHVYLAYRVIKGIIKVDDYVMLVAAAETFTSCLHGIIEQVLDIRKNADFMSEYKKFMEYPAVKALKNTPVNLTKDHVIEFKNVSFKYPRSDQLVLKNLSLTINSGERLSVVGLNGAGKTTFIKLLCRLYDPTEGEILLNGVNIKELDYDRYLEIFSVVFQDFHLLHLTVRENVALEKSGGNDEEVYDALEKSGLLFKIESISRGLDTVVFKDFDKEGIEFSGGESQKLAIARAIYKAAPIVILDEPTAALDPVAEYEIFSRFNNLIGDKTTIYISHRLSSSRFCDNIAVFDDGRLVQYGTHEELAHLGEGLYSRMWKAQAQYYV